MSGALELNMPWLTLGKGDALDDLLLRTLSTGHDPADLLLRSFAPGDEVKCFP